MPPWSFVGRVTELTRLVAAATAAPGSGMILSGTAGVGRSRLLARAVAALDADRLAVWSIAASAATADIPLGSLSGSLPPGTNPCGAVPSPGCAVDALEQQAAGRAVVVAVDDVHLLDTLSAAVIAYLVRSGRATMLGTVRCGAPVADPVQALWTHGPVTRVELGPLTELETAELLSQAMGGPVDSTSLDRFWRLAGGSVLALRELVAAAYAAGTVVEQHGVWRWTGWPEPAPTLDELIERRIARLAPDVLAVLEFTAFGEPIGLPLLAAATGSAAIERATTRGLVRLVPAGRRTAVRLAQSCCGEVIRRRCPPARQRRLLAELAALVEGAGTRRRGDLLRAAIWRLGSGTTQDAARLLDACRLALAMYDLPLALRLARAAAALGAGAPATEALATVMVFAGRPSRAVTLLDAAEPAAAAPSGAARIVIRGIGGYWGLGDELTIAGTAAAAARLTDPGDVAGVRAVEASMRLHHGEFRAALTLARLVLDDPASRPASRVLALGVMAYLRAVRGEPVRAAGTVARCDRDAASWRIEAPHAQLAVELARGTATILAGDLAAVDSPASAGFAAMAQAGGFRPGSGYHAIVRAQAARLRGALDAAAGAAGRAVELLADGAWYAGLAHAERAHAAALMADPGTAADAMAEADRVHRPTMAVLYPWLEYARCWVAACTGDLAGAAALARGLLVRLRSDRFLGCEVVALHDLVRLGQADQVVVDRLRVLARLVEGGYVRVVARHAHALAERDGTGLLAAADEYAGLGMHLFAAEAASAAVTRLRGARAAGTPRALLRLAELRSACPLAHTPALEIQQPTLTGRERQIARLAAVGVPSKEIGERLFLSSRTVDNHLVRVYAKLGVAGRGELAATLGILPIDDE